ncbi:MAG TPA: hypothetical protein VK154_18365 [Chitinophagales bacterium]|nr:hypothetical protein [Chitinophagales bacterium]
MIALSIEELLTKQQLIPATYHQFLKIIKGGNYDNRLLSQLGDDDKNKLKKVIADWLEVWFARQLELQKLYARLNGLSEKEATYEFNRQNIDSYIRKYVVCNRKIPSTQNIAENLRLTRKTVSKHLADKKNARNEAYDKYQTLTDDMLGTVAGVALRDDDVKAAKAYMDMIHKLKQDGPAPIQVQLDDFVITQPMLDRLTAAQKDTIRGWLKDAEDIEEADVQVAEEVIEEVEVLEEKKVDKVMHKAPKLPRASREEKVKEDVPEDKKVDNSIFRDPNGGPTLFG